MERHRSISSYGTEDDDYGIYRDYKGEEEEEKRREDCSRAGGIWGMLRGRKSEVGLKEEDRRTRRLWSAISITRRTRKEIEERKKRRQEEEERRQEERRQEEEERRQEERRREEDDRRQEEKRIEEEVERRIQERSRRKEGERRKEEIKQEDDEVFTEQMEETAPNILRVSSKSPDNSPSIAAQRARSRSQVRSRSITSYDRPRSKSYDHSPPITAETQHRTVKWKRMEEEDGFLKQLKEEDDTPPSLGNPQEADSTGNDTSNLEQEFSENRKRSRVRSKSQCQKLSLIVTQKHVAKKSKNSTIDMAGTMVRRTSIAVQKMQQKHSIEQLNKRLGTRKCKELKMIAGDMRIGKNFDFKSGGVTEDLSFEKEKTLLELWELYRNGYSTDEVLQRMYIPVICIENGKSVKCTGERWGIDESILTELRNRYQEIRSHEMELREQLQLDKYNELHKRTTDKGLLDVISSRGTSPGPSSRPRSMMSFRDSPNNGSTEQMLKNDEESSLLCQCCPCYPSYITEE